MGYGAYMVINNKNSSSVQCYVTDQNCMHDGDSSGSNLSIFNNADIPPNGSVPSSGTQYIEAKNSGSCFFQDATFSLKLETSVGTLIGNLDFDDSSEKWSCTNNSNKTMLDVYINNSGDQAKITITIESV